MSLNDSHIRQLLAAKKTRRMRNYPEGSNLAWNLIDGAFAVWCVGVLAICVAVACGVK